MQTYEQVCDFLVRLKMFKRMALEDLSEMLDSEEEKIPGLRIHSRVDRDLFEKHFINLINDIVEEEYEQLIVPMEILAEAVKGYNSMRAQREEQKIDSKKRLAMLQKQTSSEVLGDHEYSVAWIQRLFSSKGSWMTLALALNLIFIVLFFNLGAKYLRNGLSS